MASLIGPLASGVRGAESGTAEIYVRGSTSTPATVYSDSGLTVAVSTHALDSYGGVTRYVTQPVDVIVKDSGGVQVRAFTWEDDARSVVLEHAAATGTSATGQSGAGAGYRTTVHAYLSSLFTSLGAKDGQVLINGGGQNIKDVLGDTTKVFFNVKNSAYGAVGDGTTDDTSAVQSAIAAADAAGGGIVYFPPGTYQMGAAGNIVLSTDNITLLGAGRNASVIRAGSGSGTAMAVTGADGLVAAFLGFTSHATSLGGSIIQITSGDYFTMLGCSMSSGAAASTTRFINYVGAARGHSYLGCDFTLRAAGEMLTFGVGSSVSFIGCDIKTSASLTSPMFSAAAETSAVGGRITSSAAAGNTILTNASATFAGIRFDSPSGGTITLSTAGTASEAGCYFNTGVLPFNSGQGGLSYTRDARSTNQTNTGTTATIDARYGLNTVRHTAGASMQFLNPTGDPSEGSPLTIVYINTTGGSRTPTFDTEYKLGTVPAVATGSAATFFFRYDLTNNKWYQIGGNAAAYAY